MSKHTKPKPISLAVGAALASSLLTLPAAQADTSPFSVTALSSGYMVADAGEGKCGEGKCGGDKGEEGSCGGDKGEEGKCGEGKCGGDKGEEGSCGGDKGEEGKCGEGKCGGDKGAETATAESASSKQSSGGATGPWLLLAGLPLLRRKKPR